MRKTVLVVIAIIAFGFLGLTARTTLAACYTVPVTPNTPSGIAGCEVWGEGIASHYGPGDGVAMNFCTWVLRHSEGCGSVNVTAIDTGLVVTVPVVDFCGCWQKPGPNGEQTRIVDLQWGVVEALGLNLEQGLYRVRVERPGVNSLPDTALSH